MTKALVGNYNKRIFGKSKTKDLIFFYALLFLPVTQFLIFYIVVNFNSILMSFQKYDSASASFVFLTNNPFKNFVSVFELSDLGLNLGKLILNSLILWACMVLFGTVPAIIFSFYIYRQNSQ